MGNAVMCLVGLCLKVAALAVTTSTALTRSREGLPHRAFPQSYLTLAFTFINNFTFMQDVCIHKIKARHIHTRASLIFVRLIDCLHHGWHCLGQRIDLVF